MFGQNLRCSITSGKVGAATVAMYVGIPAIVVSGGVDWSEQGAEPTHFPSTRNAFPHAVELCVWIIDHLEQAKLHNVPMLSVRRTVFRERPQALYSFLTGATCSIQVNLVVLEAALPGEVLGWVGPVRLDTDSIV